jgi:hypothetical protein
LALAAYLALTIVFNLRERLRQRELARTRTPLTRAESVDQMRALGLSSDIAEFLWAELKLHYFEPLTPYPSDRIYGDLKIDPDDVSDTAVRYEKQFGVRLTSNPLKCPADPTILELGLALQTGSTSTSV